MFAIGLGEKWKGISSLKRSSVMKTGILFLALYIWHILQKTLQRLILLLVLPNKICIVIYSQRKATEDIINNQEKLVK